MGYVLNCLEGKIHFLYLVYASSVLCTQLILTVDNIERNTEGMSGKRGQWPMCFLVIYGKFHL